MAIIKVVVHTITPASVYGSENAAISYMLIHVASVVYTLVLDGSVN